MPCRIGITQDPARRKGEWERAYPALNSWTVLGAYKTRSEAQAVEARIAGEMGCAAAPGGATPNTRSHTWYVYYFRF